MELRTCVAGLFAIATMVAACGGSGHPSAPSVTANSLTSTAATANTATPTAATATATSVAAPAPCPDAHVSVCEFGARVEAAFEARDVAAVVAASRARGALCGHVQESNIQDVCFGQPPAAAIPAYFTGRLHSDYGARLSPEGYVALVSGFIQSTTMGSPEPLDDFGPGRLRMYAIGPADPRICTGGCRELVFSGIAGPVTKGDALQRETLLLTIHNVNGTWAIEELLSGLLTSAELKAKLRGADPAYHRWNPREGIADPGTGGNVFAGALLTAPPNGCVKLSPTPGAAAAGACLPAGMMVQVTSGYVDVAGERWWHVRTSPSQDEGALPSSVLDGFGID